MKLWGRSSAVERGVTVLALVSDTHVNSTVGLCPPTVMRDDGGTYQASPAQAELWRSWLNYWQRVDDTVKRHKAKLFVVVNGDAVEGFHHGSTQVVSPNPTDQGKIAMQVFDPVAQRADRIFFVRGTPAHAGKAAGYEEELAKDLAAQPDTVAGTHSWWHLPLMVGGVYFSIAHHRRQNTLPWTHGGAANRLAAQIVYEYAASGDRRPDVVVRSHGHRFDESSGVHPVKVIFSPAWQLKTEYVYKLSPEALADIGGLIFVCEDGRYRWDWACYLYKRRQPWSE